MSIYNKISFTLNNYSNFLRKRKSAILIGFLVSFLCIALYLQIQVPIYRSACSVKLIESKSIADVIVDRPAPVSYNRMNLIANALVNRQVLERVIYDLGLASEKTSAKDLDNTISAIKGIVETDSESPENIMRIIVDYKNADLSAQIANAIAQTYINMDMGERGGKATSYRVLIEGQLAESKKRLEESQKNLDIFKEQNQPASGIATAIQSNISTLEKQRNEFLQNYGPQYPDIVKIDEQIEELNKELQALPEREAELAKLTNEHKANEESHRILLSKLEDALIAEKAISPEIKIVKPAIAPRFPIKPNKKRIMVLGLISSLALGIFFSLFVEAYQHSHPKKSSDIG